MAHINGIVLSSVEKIDSGCFQIVLIDIYLQKRDFLWKARSKRFDIKEIKLDVPNKNYQPSPLLPRFGCLDLLFVWQDLGML